MIKKQFTLFFFFAEICRLAKVAATLDSAIRKNLCQKVNRKSFSIQPWLHWPALVHFFDSFRFDTNPNPLSQLTTDFF